MKRFTALVQQQCVKAQRRKTVPPPEQLALRPPFVVLLHEPNMDPDALRRPELDGILLLAKTLHSTVYRANLNGENVVLKVVASDTDGHKRRAYSEVTMLDRLRGQHVIGMRAALLTPTHVVIVLEEAGRGSLRSMLRATGAVRMTEAVAVKMVVRSLVGAVAFLHAQGVVHRDIKADNLLLMEDWTLRLADLGVSVDVCGYGGAWGPGYAGTAGYLSPEALDGCPASFAQDIWAIGVVTYELLTGFKPLTCMDGPVFPSSLSSVSREFVRSCLCSEPRQRATAADLLQHPWLQSITL